MNFATRLRAAVIGLALVCAWAAAGYAQGPAWLEWDKAYAKAKKENKIVLVDVYTDWCGWCKRMDKDTYAQKPIIDRIEKDFVPVKFNPEKGGVYEYRGKQYTGQQLKLELAQGNFGGYPTTFFVVPARKESEADLIVSESGYHAPKDFEQLMDAVINYRKQQGR